MRTLPTIDELIATVKRTSLPTIFVEGKDDIEVYRKFESKIGTTKVSFLPCDGRSVVLAIFKRRHEFASKKVMFIADRDIWIFLPIPTEYQDVVFTKGYSIENDLFIDGQSWLTFTFKEEEFLQLQTILTNISTWFAFEVDKFIHNPKDAQFAINILNTNILDKNTNELTSAFLESRNFVSPSESILNDLKRNMVLKIRGKILFQIVEFIFRNRNNEELKYNEKQLFHQFLFEGIRDEEKDTNMNQLLKTIKNFLN